MCARVPVQTCRWICSLHADGDRLTLCSCDAERERGEKQPPPRLLFSLWITVLFKRRPVSSAKTTLKPPFFCHVTHYIKVRPKINAAAPETPRRPGRAPAHRRPAHLLGSEVNSLLFGIGGEMKNLVVPPDFSPAVAFSRGNCLLSSLPPEGCNWCAGTAPANNCNYQKRLVS